MSSTTDLRAMLDERGVEWEQRRGGLPTETTYEHGGIGWMAVQRMDGTLHLYCRTFLTPEQAIEATLGHAYEPPVAAHWDGDALTLTIPRDPSCIRVQRSAEQPCKVYADESKVIAATLGRGECKIHDCEGSFSAVNRPVWRCDCGAFMTQYTDATTYHKPRYCPNCGRKVRA